MDERTVDDDLVAEALDLCKDNIQEWMVRSMASPEGLPARWDDGFWNEGRWEYFYETRRRLATHGIQTVERWRDDRRYSTWHLHPRRLPELEQSLWGVGWEEVWVDWPSADSPERLIESIPGITVEVVMEAVGLAEWATGGDDRLEDERLICRCLVAAMKYMGIPMT